METGSVLLITLIFVTIVPFSFYLLSRKRSRRHLSSFEQDWKFFKLAKDNNDIEKLSEYGIKLVWNVHVKTQHVAFISDTVDALIGQYPELQELENNIFNKRLNWKKSLPYPK